MLPETAQHGALQAAERIRAQVQNKVFAEGNLAVTITVSIGVSTFPENGDDPETLLGCADDALYKAKEGGRNRVVLFGKEDQLSQRDGSEKKRLPSVP